MDHFIIGAVITAGFLFVVNYVRKHSLHIAWWQWILTLLGFAYAVFVLEVIAAFVAEGAAQGAAVLGTLLGFAAVVWGTLLSRFVFVKEKK